MTDDKSDETAYHHHHRYIFSIPLLHHLYFLFPSYGMILYADHYMTWMDVVTVVVVVS